MKNKTQKIALFLMGLSTLLLSACAGLSEGDDTPKTEAPHFYQHWVNAYEEQTAEQMVFRPKDSKDFLPSRFRMEYVFNNDGSCQYKYLSPTDAHTMKNCVYTKVGNKVYVYDDSGRVVPELSFTLSSPPTKDVMFFTKGIQKPLSEKSKKTDK